MQAEQLPFLINESIYFDYVPPPTFAGHINKHPFRLKISSSNNNVHIVNLNAKYSRSYDPQDRINKWSFLRPEYRFLDINGNKINFLTTTDTKLYKDENGLLNSISGTFVGVSGVCEFYFVDDVYNFDLAYNNQPYTTIVATLETSGVDFFDVGIDHIRSSNNSNSKAIALQPHIFHYRQPDFIKITENGIRDFINPRWSAVKQPVIFNLNWNEQYKELYYDGNEIKPINYNFNFCHYHPLSGEDFIGINTCFALLSTDFTSASSLDYFFDNSVKIEYLNSDGYIASGYNKNFFHTPPIDTTLGVILTASTNFNTPPLSGNTYSPKLWVSNPAAATMCIVEYNSVNNFPLEDFKNLSKAQLFNFDVPTVQYINDDIAIGYHNINSIAVLPSPDYKAWGYDNILRYLYKFNTDGQISLVVDIDKIINDNNLYSSLNNNLTAASIAIDEYKNIWLTDIKTNNVIKLSSDGSFITSADPMDLNLGKPYCVDTDLDNNIWVSYSTQTSGFLIKYDTNGSILNTINYSTENEIPLEIIVDKTNSFWVGVSSLLDNTSILEKRNSEGELLSAFGPIQKLNKITLDINQNLWYTNQYSTVGYINNDDGGNLNNINILSNSDYGFINILPYSTTIKGIGGDEKGLVHIINSIENQIYVYDSNTKSFIEKFYVNPQGFTVIPKDKKNIIQYSKYNNSLQASGDWTGARWNFKYNSNKNSYQLSLSGKSKILYFYAKESTALIPDEAFLSTNYFDYIETNYYQDIVVTPNIDVKPQYLKLNIDLYRNNENFNLALQIKSFAFTPTLQESTYLFNNLLPSIFGYYPFNHTDLGIITYEKISNFVSNHSDVDLCGIDQLYSLADSINENTNDYILNYPLEIKRWVDLLSINQSRLWGSNAKNQNNFNTPSREGIFNRGELLSLSYKVSAGTPVVLKTKSLDSYQLVQTGKINNSLFYPLSTLVDFIGLNKNLSESRVFYYEFYEFIPEMSSAQVDNIIDFNNPQTTINNSLSTVFSWSGDEQTIDKIFSHELYKGLGLFPT
jgi:hypothetical protein